MSHAINEVSEVGGLVMDRSRAACSCASCSRCLQMLTWYTRVAGDHLSMRVRPHLKQSTDGIMALVHSKSILTLGLTMRKVQAAFAVFGCLLLVLALRSILPGLQATPTARCAVVGIRPLSIRNGQPLSERAGASGWDFELFNDACRIAGGSRSLTGVTQLLSFPEPIEFNVIHLTSNTADGGHDPTSFVVECFPDGEPRGSIEPKPMIVAASGTCGWFVGMEQVHVANPPGSARWERVSDGAGGTVSRLVLDYTRYTCKLPNILDKLTVLVGGLTCLLTVVHARYYSKRGFMGLPLARQTAAVGFATEAALSIGATAMAWHCNVPLFLYQVGLLVLNLTFVASERYAEVCMTAFGFWSALLALTAVSNEQGTTDTTLFARNRVLALSTAEHLCVVACSSFALVAILVCTRVSHVLACTRKIMPLIDECEQVWARIRKADGELHALQAVEHLATSLQHEARAERAAVARAEWGPEMRQESEARLRRSLKLGLCYARSLLKTGVGGAARPVRQLLLAPRDMQEQRHVLPAEDTAARAAQRRRLYHRLATPCAQTQVPEVRCLDQLYVQAVVIMPMFQRKVRGWAQAAGESGQRECEWQEVIKSCDRSATKVMQHYDGSVQFLVDVVRHRFVLDSVASQHRCLAAICSDPDVIVVEIENGQAAYSRDLSAREKETASAGSGALVVRFVMTTEEAYEVGVAGHVMELQLLVRRVWEVVGTRAAEADMLAYHDALMCECWPSWLVRRALQATTHLRCCCCWWYTRRIASGEEEVEAEQRAELGQGREMMPVSAVQAQGDGDGGGVASIGLVAADGHAGAGGIPSQDTLGVNGDSGVAVRHLVEFFSITTSDVAEPDLEGGLCEEREGQRQGIPPALAARLGIDEAGTSFDPHAILCTARKDGRLRELLDMLCSLSLARAPASASMGESCCEKEAACTRSETMREILRTKCLSHGVHLSEKLNKGSSEAGLSAHWASLLFSSNPITLALHKWQYKLLIFVCGVAMFLQEAYLWASVNSNTFKASRVRFTATHQRAASALTAADVASANAAPTKAGAPGVQSFGLLYNGCPLAMDAASVWTEGASMMVSFPHEVEANGFYFRTSADAGSEYLDPIGFKVMVSSCLEPKGCAQQDWTVVGSSRCLWTIYSIRCLPVEDGLFETPVERNLEHFTDLRISNNQLVVILLNKLNCFIGCWGCTLLAMFGHYHAGRRFLALVTYFVNGILCMTLLPALMLANNAEPIQTIYPVVGGIAGLIIGCGILRFEYVLIRGHVVVFGALLIVLAVFFDGFVVYKNAAYFRLHLLLEGWWWEPIVLLFFAFFLHAARKYALLGAWKVVKSDFCDYELAWKALRTADEQETDGGGEHGAGSPSQLSDLASKVRQISDRISELRLAAVQQAELSAENDPFCARGAPVPTSDVTLLVGGDGEGHGFGGGAEEDGGRMPKAVGSLIYSVFGMSRWWRRPPAGLVACECLDQLYLQAHLLWPSFCDKVLEWGGHGNAYLTSRARGVYISAADLGRRKEIKWAPIKSSLRAVEKVARSYDFNVHQLVDVVRQQLIFDSVADLSVCLDMIAKDADVRIVRIKNRLSTTYDPAHTAGYRDVSLNIRIVTEEAQSLGLSGHVCELQLILKEFFLLRSDDGHGRFVSFRNLRAE